MQRCRQEIKTGAPKVGVDETCQEECAERSCCCIYCEDGDHSRQSDCPHSTKCGLTSKGLSVIVTGPRGTLWRGSNRISVELSLLGKKRLQFDKWWRNGKELATVRTVGHVQIMIKGVTVASVTR